MGKITDYRGFVAAAFTPFYPDGMLHLAQVGKIVEHLIADGVQGLYVCGSTGEGPSLTVDERQATAEAYIKAAAGRIPVIVHVGHDSLQEARGLAAHAVQIGADAVAAMPPAYFKCRTLEALIASLHEIASAAEGVPFYYYHIPALSGLNFSMTSFLEQAAQCIPNLAGIKFSDANLHELQGCVDLQDGRFNVLFGVDEMVLGAWAMGATGAVGSTYNFAAPLYRKAVGALEAGDLDEARLYQGLAGEAVRVLQGYRGLPGIKAMMSLIGLDCGPCRLPHVALSVAELQQLRSDMRTIGFFDWGR